MLCMLVLLGSLIGIALRQAPVPAVSLAAWVVTGLVALLLVWSAVRPLKLNA